MPHRDVVYLAKLYIGNNETCRNAEGTNDCHVDLKELKLPDGEYSQLQFTMKGRKFLELSKIHLTNFEPCNIRNGHLRIGNTIHLRHGGGAKEVPVVSTSEGTFLIELVET